MCDQKGFGPSSSIHYHVDNDISEKKRTAYLLRKKSGGRMPGPTLGIISSDASAAGYTLAVSQPP